MEIAIRGSVDWSQDLRQHVERSVEVAVGRHESRIQRVTVWLSDLNGPRGGVDQQCQITADIRGTQPVLIVERGANLKAVISRAARRLGYRVGRQVLRHRIPHQREYRTTIRAA